MTRAFKARQALAKAILERPEGHTLLALLLSSRGAGGWAGVGVIGIMDTPDEYRRKIMNYLREQIFIWKEKKKYSYTRAAAKLGINLSALKMFMIMKRDLNDENFRKACEVLSILDFTDAEIRPIQFDSRNMLKLRGMMLDEINYYMRALSEIHARMEIFLKAVSSEVGLDQALAIHGENDMEAGGIPSMISLSNVDGQGAN